MKILGALMFFFCTLNLLIAVFKPIDKSVEVQAMIGLAYLVIPTVVAILVYCWMRKEERK